jgi:hypothetical protein
LDTMISRKGAIGSEFSVVTGNGPAGLRRYL